MRYVEPLDEEEWNFVMECLKRGPTKKQKEMIKQAVENASKMVTYE